MRSLQQWRDSCGASQCRGSDTKRSLCLTGMQSAGAAVQRRFRNAGRGIAHDWLQAPGRPAARLMVDLDRPEICSFSSGTSTCSATTVQTVMARPASFPPAGALLRVASRSCFS